MTDVGEMSGTDIRSVKTKWSRLHSRKENFFSLFLNYA